jgi:serine/threonine protein kinase
MFTFFYVSSVLRHPNIILLIGIVYEKPIYMIITELMESSLMDIIHMEDEKHIPFPLVLISDIIYQIVCGMNYLAARDPPIFHLDLKSSNILVQKSSPNWKIKIIDFGLSKLKMDIMPTLSRVGSCQWCSPESNYNCFFL